MILLVCALYSFLGNCALLGPSVYIGLYAEEFNITPTKASDLVSYPNLAFGFGERSSLNVNASFTNICRLIGIGAVISQDRKAPSYAHVIGVCKFLTVVASRVEEVIDEYSSARA